MVVGELVYKVSLLSYFLELLILSEARRLEIIYIDTREEMVNRVDIGESKIFSRRRIIET